MHEENNADPDEVRQTEMEELNPEWHTSGCIIHEGKAHLVTAHIALLIMQTRLYAEMQADAHERDAATATTESNRLLLIRIARDLRRWVAGDRAFLESSTSLWQCSISLAVRAKLGFLSVTEDNFEGYIAEVMQNVLPARRAIPPTFLLVTGPNQPEFFVTLESAHLAQFASEWIYRRVVSKADLTRLYNRVAEEFPSETKSGPAAEPLKSAESEPGNHLIDSLLSGVLHPSINFSGSPLPRMKRSDTKKQDRADTKKQDRADTKKQDRADKGNDRNG